MTVMWFGWITVRRLTKRVSDSDTVSTNRDANGILDIIDLQAIDLTSDEYRDVVEDGEEEALRQKRISQGKQRFLWKIYYLAA